MQIEKIEKELSVLFPHVPVLMGVYGREMTVLTNRL